MKIHPVPVAAVILLSALLGFAADAPAPATVPALGAHGLVFIRPGSNKKAELAVPALATAKEGSTLLVMVAMGDWKNLVAPKDSPGNKFTAVGKPHNYTNWLHSGMALYAAENATGDGKHIVAEPLADPRDEVTLAVTEITHGGVVKDFAVKEVLKGQGPYKSAIVTTTGPALLVAWWFGDDGGGSSHTATPDNGFKVIDSVLLQGALVQCAVAVKQVDVAGTYEVTWKDTPDQGCVLWLVAVEKGK